MDNQALVGFLFLMTVVIGTSTFSVYEGEEHTCRTGDGWTILEEYPNWYSAVCEYKTKDWKYKDCTKFRETSSYERYACTEAIVIEHGEPTIPGPKRAILKYSCDNIECKAI